MESRPSLVLIVDDQEWMSRSLESVLQPGGFAVLRAFTGRQCIALAASTRPDAVIVNLQLPDMTGFEVLQALRDGPAGDQTPRIAITWDAPSRAERLRALEAGAWTVCAQPIDADLVMGQLRTFLRARRSYEAVLEGGLLDPESGLYNARGLARRAREVGAEAQRRREPLTCVAFGPELSGLDESLVEEVLDRTVARLLEVVVRSGRVSDVIGRVGRSEFAAVLPATDARGAERLIERLQAAIGSESVGPPARLRAGYVAVQGDADGAADPVDLLLRAAAAMRHSPSLRDVATMPGNPFDAVTSSVLH